MNTDRDLGDFWAVQAQLAQTLQLELARALAAARIAAKPASMLDMERSAQALQRCGEVYDVAQWRLDTVQILAREERAALEALESATRAEKEQAATGIVKRKENAPQAQTAPKKGKSND